MATLPINSARFVRSMVRSSAKSLAVNPLFCFFGTAVARLAIVLRVVTFFVERAVFLDAVFLAVTFTVALLAARFVVFRRTDLDLVLPPVLRATDFLADFLVDFVRFPPTLFFARVLAVLAVLAVRFFATRHTCFHAQGARKFT